MHLKLLYIGKKDAPDLVKMVGRYLEVWQDSELPEPEQLKPYHAIIISGAEIYFNSFSSKANNDQRFIILIQQAEVSQISQNPMTLVNPLIDFVPIDYLGLLLPKIIQQVENHFQDTQTIASLNSELKRKIDRLTDMQQGFLSGVTHELRTPLNTIVGYSELIEEEAVDLKEQGIVEDIRLVRNAAEDLKRIIDKVINLSNLSSDDIVVNPLPIDKKSLTRFFQQFGQSTQISLPPSLPKIETDFEILKLALFEIVENAIKFCPQKPIEIIVNQDRNGLEIKIQDSGIGMTTDTLEGISDIFGKGDYSNSRRFGGIGIGLSLTKRALQIINSHLEIASELHHGTTVTIRLPRSLPPSIGSVS